MASSQLYVISYCMLEILVYINNMATFKPLNILRLATMHENLFGSSKIRSHISKQVDSPLSKNQVPIS